MALTNKLTAIADAIRAKTGKTNPMTLDEMPTEISNITTGSVLSLKPTDYPDYVRKEVNRVADDVRRVLASDSIVSICLSDSHFPADNNTRSGGTHAMMAIKALTYLLPVDFIAHLGDVGFEGRNVTDTTSLETNMKEMLSYVKESSGDSVPLFVAIGNHDTSTYVTSGDNTDLLSGEFLYNNFTSLSASDNTVFSGEASGGYCYRDFPDKRVRVFLLNTCEGIVTNTGDGTSVTQRAWLASKLQELNTKSDAAKWGFIVLCHYPADYGSSKTLSNVFEAYVNGTSITLNGTTYNFSGANAAKFIVQFHGHIHNFLVDKLYGGSVSSRLNGTPTAQYDAYRMAIPNAQYDRENYYYYTDSSGNIDPASDGTLWGIKFFQGTYELEGEDEACHKTVNSSDDTSFVVNVINPSEQMIHSICYGAGYNRALSYAGTVYYTVTSSLENVEIDNESIVIQQGASYVANLTITKDNYEIMSIEVKMDGVDITDDVYSDGVITIPEVTGNVIIDVVASKVPTSNLSLLAYSFDANSTEIYNNGLGYKNGYRLSGNGVAEWETSSSGEGHVVTGCIPYDGIKTIVVSGATIDDTDGACRLYLTNNARDYIYSPWIIGGAEKNFAYAFNVEVLEIDNKYRLAPKKNFNSATTLFAMSLKGTGEDLIVKYEDSDGNTVYPIMNDLTELTNDNSTRFITSGSSYTATLTPNESCKFESVVVKMGKNDITNEVYADGVINIPNVTNVVTITAVAVIDEDIITEYSITNNLTNVSSSNTATAVEKYGSYTATLTVTEGELVYVTVTMRNVDITSSVYADGVITIPEVTGNVVISAYAGSITNQLPISTDADGAIYNGVGYKADTYLSYGEDKSRTGYYTTGFIPIQTGDTIYFRNCGIQDEQSYHRFAAYNSNKVLIENHQQTTVENGELSVGTPVWGDDGYMKSITIGSYWGTSYGIAYMRFCCSYLGEDSIVTINEPLG